jgi:PAS domain-containing protein
LLKIYARFLEQVRGDLSTAGKFYQEAAKAGTNESLLGLIANEEGASSMSAAGTIDEAIDGLIIINAQGIILMVNAAAINMLGYGKGELEGKNVSVLM